MKIDVASLDIKLADRGARQDCPFCGRVYWTVDERPAAVPAANPDTGEVIPDASVPAAIFVCGNCGFIRLHALAVLLDETG